jgi:hypothetical protein
MATEITQKNSKIYTCLLCDFSSCNKNDYNRHNLTQKHIRNVSATFGNNLATEKTLNCDYCGKPYKDRTGLWKHKKNCYYKENNIKEIDEPTDKQLIMMLVKQNTDIMKENSELRKEQSDIKELILEIVKNGTGTTNNNIYNNNNTTHTNSHNKAFNLNFFLNETCKNAMNITDFVESIKLQLTDFMEVGEAGYVQGISNIIVKRLNDLDETVRPIHCTDQKRETFYVKDENKWEKEEDDMNKIRKMIKKVSYKNERLMSSYKEMFPDYNDPESKNSDRYSKFVIEAMGGEGNNTKEKETKIIRNISKNVIIKK